MSADENISSSGGTYLSKVTGSAAFTVFRWLFILGLISVALRILGLWGDSDVARVVKAVQGNDPGKIINDVLIDGVLIGALFFAILRPRRPVFVLGASIIFFLYWIGAVFVVTGISKGNLADELSFMARFTTLSGISAIIAGAFPLFGFLAITPPGDEPKASGRSGMKLVEIAVPVVAGLLLAIVPTQHFTGSTPFNSTDLQGFGIKLFVVGGILAAISGIIRRPSVNLFWGVMMSMSLLETWLGVTHLHTANRPSLWPGIGMVIGIVGCLLLLFSEPAARLATRWLFARRPIITESV